MSVSPSMRTFSGSAIISESLPLGLGAKKAVRLKWWRCVHKKETCKSHMIVRIYEFTTCAACIVTLNRNMCYIDDNIQIKHEKMCIYYI